MLRLIILLVFSNVFMTFGWYYHLRHTNWPIWKAIILSWTIAFVEYCLVVPANRLGTEKGVTLFQLKITQEVVSLVVFGLYAVFVANNHFEWRYLISFIFLCGAVFFMFYKN